jgi:hypothetical protein
MTDHEAHNSAERFWAAADAKEGFPRTLERTVLQIFPLVIVKLPGLGVAAMRRWLSNRGVRVGALVPDKGLRGGLFARGGVGVVFLDGMDTADEARFSLAHEVSHFLLDYLWPREAAVLALGEGVREVLDSARPPSHEERLSAVLRRVKLGFFTHLLDRDRFGQITRATVLEAEDRADRLALELLAPRQEVVTDARRHGIEMGESGSAASLTALLTVTFGLPESCSQRYAQHLLGRSRGRKSFRDWLGVGKKLQSRRNRPGALE